MEIVITVCRFLIGKLWDIIRDDLSLYSFGCGAILRHLGMELIRGEVVCRSKIYIGTCRLFFVFNSTNVFLALEFGYRRECTLWHI